VSRAAALNLSASFSMNQWLVLFDRLFFAQITVIHRMDDVKMLSALASRLIINLTPIQMHARVSYGFSFFLPPHPTTFDRRHIT
jgi:hypothetical protein